MKYILRILIVQCLFQIAVVSAQNLSIASAELTKTEIRLEIMLENNTDNDFLLLTPDSKKRDETRYYLTLDENKRVLGVRRNFYSYPDYITDVRLQCFSLKRIPRHSIVKEFLTIQFPVSTTYLTIDLKLDLRKVISVQAYLALLPIDESIAALQRERPFGDCFDGSEKIQDGSYQGKKLFEIQHIVRSGVVKLN